MHTKYLGVNMINEIKCLGCGKTSVTGEPTIINRRTGKKPPGLGTLILGLILLAGAAFFIVLILINWGDPVVPGQKYIMYPIILLVGGIPALYSYFRADRVKVMTYKCDSCGKTFTENDLANA